MKLSLRRFELLIIITVQSDSMLNICRNSLMFFDCLAMNKLIGFMIIRRRKDVSIVDERLILDHFAFYVIMPALSCIPRKVLH